MTERTNYYTGLPPKRLPNKDGTPRKRTAFLKRRALDRERSNLDHAITENLNRFLIGTLKRRALLDRHSDEVKAAYQIVVADLEDSLWPAD